MSRAAAAFGALLLGLIAGGCASITELAPGIAFIDIRGPSPAEVPLGGRVVLSAVALSSSNAPVEAAFEWFTPDTLNVRVDRLTGDVTGRQVGTARIQARTGEAVSGFFTLTVVPPPAP